MHARVLRTRTVSPVSRMMVAVALLACSFAAHAAEVAQLSAPVSPQTRTAFTIYLPLRDTAALQQLLRDQQDPAAARYQHWLTPAQFAARFGISDALAARIAAALAPYGMAVGGRTAQSLQVTASAGAVERAFATRLRLGRFPDGTQDLVADPPLSLPAALRQEGAVIADFSPIRRKHGFTQVAAARPANEVSDTGPYFTADLRQAYDFPSAAALTAKGVTIAVVVPGAYDAADIATYFAEQGLASPALATVEVGGGSPFDGNSVETELDIEQAAGMAPGAAITLYNARSFADADLLQAITEILIENKADIVNMSWGEPELAFQPKYNNGSDQRPEMQRFDQLFLQGTAQGISFVAASGDGGAIPVIDDTLLLSVNHPASDPYVTGVGGTNLLTAFDANDTSSAYVSENADDDPLEESPGGVWGSGGGVSVTFRRPIFQYGVATGSTLYRTVPDVAMHMGGCPSTARIPCGPHRSADFAYFNGQWVALIGTSAAAPDFAGLLALKVALARGTSPAPLGRLGNENTDIYRKLASQSAGGAAVYRHAAISGGNGAYGVRAPYDMVLGAGTVDARRFLGATNLPAAGNPGSAGNP